MATTDREMNYYTFEERLLLWSCLPYDIEIIKRVFEYKGLKYTITLDTLTDIFEAKESSIFSSLVNSYIIRELLILIRDISIEDVPMYVGVLPEVAAWRLKIGK